MESYPKLIVGQSDSKKVLISFLYSISSAYVLIDDTISLFVEESTEALASVNVGNPKGHWCQGNFKVGQVTLDISAVTVYLDKRYSLCYVSQDTIRSSLALTWKPEDGAFTEYREQNNEQEPATSPAIQDYTFASGNIYSDTSSFECPRMSSQTSSSFVVVDEIDSKPQEPEELLVVENGADDFHRQPDFEGFPDPVNSQSNPESEPWAQSPWTPTEILSKTEDVEENIEVPSTTSQTNDPADDLVPSDIPLEMSASVNWDDRPQREVKLLRSNNKDLHQKIRKLTKIMETMQNELVVLREKPGDSEETTEKIRRLESEIKQKSDSHEILIAKLNKLKEEKHILQKKNTQLTTERNTQFERSATLLNELQDKEKENEVLQSENIVLQGKVKRLENNERKKKRQPNQEPDQRRAKLDPINFPVKLTPHKTPVDNGPKAEPPTSRPSDLPLTGGAKLKPAPPPQIVPQERRQAPEVRKTHQPLLAKQPARQPLKSSSQTKPETQKRGDTQTRGNPAHASKPLRSDQRASDMTISERRVGELANSLRGTPSIVCPICQKSLHAREDEYSVLLHVEQCLKST